MTRDFSRVLTILYGSETGTAQEVAENIWRESKAHHFRGKVLSMDEYEIKNLIDEKIVIFVVATTGQGDEPQNMKSFWKFLLRKSLPANSLQSMNFVVIGLGDSSYLKYNFAAKRLHKRLLQLGANSLLSICLCDDQHDLGIAGALCPWMYDFWKVIDELYPLPLNLRSEIVEPKKTRWNVIRMKEQVDENPDIYSNIEESNEDGYAEVISNERTTSADHFQDVRLISFNCELKWEIGDVAYVRPQNSKEAVDRLFEIFKEHNLDFADGYNCCVMLEDDEEITAPRVLKKPLTLRTIATQFWDLSAKPKPRAFAVLAYNCENELEKEKLIELSSYEGQEDWLNYVNRPRRNILEVLNDFPHATSKLTLELLFELFIPIKQRPFSIASSPLTKRLDILVAVVEYYTNLKAQRKGFCSNWLKNLQQGDRVRISIKKGTFKFPKEISTPLIMIGPGTGLAIFRGIIQDYVSKSESSNDKLVLFFGCRYMDKDFHCRDELKKLEDEGKLKLFCAFSRDQNHKIYVQDLIINQKSLLKDLIINKGGHFYVSGNSKNMPNAVKDAIKKALEDADYVENMIKTERYQEETWA
ncbi:hypothetical protein PVAND_008428 [Polypedilum vanderplanki]|uniref:NADPH-dependent diflavin oxidoreductase 1 n=1 Tax=Polypedilum vanderplanki TaxID=319348 RepID=A0A9J6C9L9_POLVA|nr:hypothetical protein PVAND_008428 [Polypedilum vanderplanki]